MSRGKPTTVQLDMTMGIMDALDAESDMNAENGMDTRNYGSHGNRYHLYSKKLCDCKMSVISRRRTQKLDLIKLTGVAAFASPKANVEEVKKFLTIQTIGYDKVNQLRHVRFFKNLDGMLEHRSVAAAISSDVG